MKQALNKAVAKRSQDPFKLEWTFTRLYPTVPTAELDVANLELITNCSDDAGRSIATYRI